MSSFGGMDIHVEELGIDYLISSANKCIQGVPGFGFVIAKLEKLQACEGNARSLSLDLYDQWKEMDKDGKWRYTSPTHVVAAFAKALEELIEEGGVLARFARYQHNNRLLRERLAKSVCMPISQPTNNHRLLQPSYFQMKHFTLKTFMRLSKQGALLSIQAS